MKVKCFNCKKWFDKPPSIAKSRRYCSRKCMGEYYGRYYIKEKSSHWQGGQIKRICKNCNNKFYVDRCNINRKDRNNNALFCSQSCKAKYQHKGNSNPNYKGGKVKKVCEICGKEYYVIPALSTKTRFCSYRCLGINAQIKMPKKDTMIEKIVEKYLINKKIKFTKQKVIEGISISDFFIEPNIHIYCDGSYWHNIPKVKERDKRINEELRNKNYLVIRLSEKEIKNEEFEQRIQDKI